MFTPDGRGIRRDAERRGRFTAMKNPRGWVCIRRADRIERRLAAVLSPGGLAAKEKLDPSTMRPLSGVDSRAGTAFPSQPATSVIDRTVPSTCRCRPSLRKGPLKKPIAGQLSSEGQGESQAYLSSADVPVCLEADGEQAQPGQGCEQEGGGLGDGGWAEAGSLRHAAIDD